MSLVNLAHVCSHLQNASNARLGLTSIPVSKLHANLAIGLLREGFLSSVTLGGVSPPKPFLQQTVITPAEQERIARQLAEKPWLAYPMPEETAEEVDADGSQAQLHSADTPAPASTSSSTPPSSTTIPSRRPSSPSSLRSTVHPLLRGLPPDDHPSSPSIPQNPARRRLWLGLKYHKSQAVLTRMSLISKPTRRIWLTSEDLAKITHSRPSAYVKGLTRPGECMFVTTDRGILEARECVERRVGGMALCRVW